MGLLTTNSCWKEKGEDYFDYYLFDRLKIKKDEMHAVMPKYKKKCCKSRVIYKSDNSEELIITKTKRVINCQKEIIL